MPEAPAVESAPAPAAIEQSPAVVKGAMDDSFSAIESMASEDGSKPAAKAAPAKVPVKETPKVEKEVKKPETVKAPEKKEEPATDTPPEKMAPKALRDAYSKSKQEAAELRKQLEAVKNTAPKEFKIDEAPEYRSLKEKHTALLKQNEELENTVRYTNYEASNEFKEKYQEPYEKAAKLSTLSAQQLKITTKDETTGETSARNLTAEEFWNIVQQTNDEDALTAAEKLFGEGSARAARVVELRDKVVQAHAAAQQAKEDFKKNAGERAKQIQEQQQEFTKSQTEAFNKHRDEAIAKYPQWFKADEGDDKGAELLEKGMAWADKVISSELPPEQAAKMHAALRNKAGGFDHMVHKCNKLNTALADALEKLKQYEESTPSNGETVKGRTTASEDDDTIEGGLNRIDQLAEKD